MTSRREFFFPSFDEKKHIEKKRHEYLVSRSTSKTEKNPSYTFEKRSYFHHSYSGGFWAKIEHHIFENNGEISAKSLLYSVTGQDSGEFDCILSDYFNLSQVLNKLQITKPESNSLINFIRHFPILDDYLNQDNYELSVDDNYIRLNLWKNDINLVIYFQSDYLISFYSYDKGENCEKDSLIYSMKGTFSSSSDIKKSYKIERLLAVLDACNKSCSNKRNYEKDITWDNKLIMSNQE